MTDTEWSDPTRPEPMGHRRNPPLAAGSSLLELLLAALIFQVALLAVAPLFLRALSDLRSGAARAEAAMLAAGLVDSSPEPGTPAAQEPGPARRFYSRAERRWQPEPPSAPDLSLWVGEERLLRYPLSSIDDGRVTPAEAGDTDSSGEPQIWLQSRELGLSRAADAPPLLTLERLEWTVE